MNRHHSGDLPQRPVDRPLMAIQTKGNFEGERVLLFPGCGTIREDGPKSRILFGR